MGANIHECYEWMFGKELGSFDRCKYKWMLGKELGSFDRGKYMNVKNEC